MQTLPHPSFRRALATLLVHLAGCTSPSAPLAEYSRHNQSERQNLPQSYIEFLKTTRYTDGRLDHLPANGIVLYGDPLKYLPLIGLTPDQYAGIDIGTTDASILYVVRPRVGAPFLVNRGEAGAGGIATQTAELIALGCTRIVHIGTCGLLGDTIPDPRVIVSDDSYKDGAAVMLSDGPPGAIARQSKPDAAFSSLFRSALADAKIPFATGHGYTVPIYYFQPAGLVDDLLRGPAFAAPRPDFLEMEEASFFETARLMNAAAASLVVGADRYALDADGKVTHTFLDDAAVTQSVVNALRATRAVFDRR